MKINYEVQYMIQQTETTVEICNLTIAMDKAFVWDLHLEKLRETLQAYENKSHISIISVQPLSFWDKAKNNTGLAWLWLTLKVRRKFLELTR